MSRLCPALLDALPPPCSDGKPVSVSIGGAPGSGKSTLARMLCAVLVQGGKHCQLISLDDYYLPLAERQRLAGRIHPLCLTRGVPGTHDLTLLTKHLDHMIQGDLSDLAMPQFDKARDDRHRRSRHCEFDQALDYLLLEGWLCGAPAQPDDELTQALNQLESSKDAGQVWRRWVNRNLHQYHDALDQRMDRRWYLRAPDWESVVDWRWQQERELPVPALKSRLAVVDFLAHYQRLVEHMQRTSGQWADLVIPLDAAHCATIP